MIKNNNLSNGNLLIIGGTGFIGVNVAKEAVNRGFQVSIISKNKCSSSKQIKGVEYIAVDITKKEELFSELKDKSFHYVLNLGGYVNHANYSEGGSEVFKAHFNGTVNLVNCVNKTNLQKFIQIGSSDEYGDNVAPQNESQREAPISPYSLAKSAATHFLQMLYRTESFPVVVLRLFLVYGVGQDVNRFIPQIIQGCVNNNKFPVSGGEQLRDFCHIDDISNAIFLALSNKNANGEVINIASGAPVSIKDVICLIKSLIGSGKPQFGLVPYRISGNMELFADISKAKRILGWSPKVSLVDGLKKVIDQHARH
jgi:nucleoside-diphosphate-sugar epimerase